MVGDIKGIDAMKAEVQVYRDAFPDIHFQITDIVVSGEKVVTRWTATGTHRGTFLGQLATGRQTSVEGITFARVHNGKISEQFPMWDTLRVAQSLGMLPGIDTEDVAPTQQAPLH
jgi:steroid delta-isomerase-like uncharacterized protein